MFRPIFGHFQVGKKLKELAYICVRCKNMLRTIKMLKNEGSCVVVMDKEEYLRLLAEASTNDATKFRLVETDK